MRSSCLWYSEYYSPYTELLSVLYISLAIAVGYNVNVMLAQRLCVFPTAQALFEQPMLQWLRNRKWIQKFGTNTFPSLYVPQ